MPTILTSQNKNTDITVTSEDKLGNNPTWAEADFTWDEGSGTWDDAGTAFIRETKNSLTVTPQDKN